MGQCDSLVISLHFADKKIKLIQTDFIYQQQQQQQKNNRFYHTNLFHIRKVMLTVIVMLSKLHCG